MSDTAIAPAPASTATAINAIAIDPNAPWASWPEQTPVRGHMRALHVAAAGEALEVSVATGEGSEERLGLLAGEGLNQLAMHLRFPVEFIQKLTPATRATVINERVAEAPEKEMTFLRGDDHFTHMLPSWREVIPYRETAQFAVDLLRASYSDAAVRLATADNGAMRLRVLLPHEEPVTRSLGDVLRAGVDVDQCYGRTTGANLFTERLVCLNGMTSTRAEFKWSSREMGSRAAQLSWLRSGIESAIASYQELVWRARRMAETTFDGDGHAVLTERMTSLRISRGLHQAIVAAYDEEPGNTEWHLVNALTRVATHSPDVTPARQRLLQFTAGEFTREFSLVEARLPNSIAQRVGARILRTAADLAEAAN